MLGLPIGADGEYAGSALDLLRPYPIVTGLFAVATFAMHGSIFLYLKTEGSLQARIHGWMWTTFGLFLVMYMLTTIMTLVEVPAATKNFKEHAWLWLVVLLNILAIANIPRAILLGRPLYAFASSCATIAAFTFLFGVALFPNMIASSLGPQNNLTIYNSASSPKTLGIMLAVAVLGMPFILSYTIVVYWIFRGKVRLEKTSY
jgi:cytochrome d ubiquinol oxidase subunit II